MHARARVRHYVENVQFSHPPLLSLSLPVLAIIAMKFSRHRQGIEGELDHKLLKFRVPLRVSFAGILLGGGDMVLPFHVRSHTHSCMSDWPVG
jgi:hypothetical protein